MLWSVCFPLVTPSYPAMRAYILTAQQAATRGLSLSIAATCPWRIQHLGLLAEVKCKSCHIASLADYELRSAATVTHRGREASSVSGRPKKEGANVPDTLQKISLPLSMRSTRMASSFRLACVSSSAVLSRPPSTQMRSCSSVASPGSKTPYHCRQR